MTETPTTGPAQESRAVHRCESLRRDGTVCNRYVATLWVDGAWRCPSHRPRTNITAPGEAAPKLPKPPVNALTDPADALKLSSWAAIQLARGRLDHQRANALATQCREFRRCFAVEARHKQELALVAAWELAMNAEEAGDRDTLTEARAQMRTLFTQMGVPEKNYRRPNPEPDQYGGTR